MEGDPISPRVSLRTNMFPNGRSHGVITPYEQLRNNIDLNVLETPPFALVKFRKQDEMSLAMDEKIFVCRYKPVEDQTRKASARYVYAFVTRETHTELKIHYESVAGIRDNPDWRTERPEEFANWGELEEPFQYFRDLENFTSLAILYFLRRDHLRRDHTRTDLPENKYPLDITLTRDLITKIKDACLAFKNREEGARGAWKNDGSAAVPEKAKKDPPTSFRSSGDCKGSTDETPPSNMRKRALPSTAPDTPKTGNVADKRARTESSIVDTETAPPSQEERLKALLTTLPTLKAFTWSGSLDPDVITNKAKTIIAAENEVHELLQGVHQASNEHARIELELARLQRDWEHWRNFAAKQQEEAEQKADVIRKVYEGMAGFEIMQMSREVEKQRANKHLKTEEGREQN